MAAAGSGTFAPALASGVGGVYWRGTPLDPVDIFNATPFGSRFRSLGLYIEPSTPAGEIAGALTQSTLLMHQLTEAGVSPAQAIDALAFSLAVDAHFLVTIAKFKALRLLLHAWASAYGVEQLDVQIHARVGPGVVSGLEPHSNMFHGTFAGIAAILGGIGSLSLFPEDSNLETLRRISRNVSIILSTEAHMDKVADPTAGAYGLDAMTDSLAEHAWSVFRKTTAP
jgi:methylmalonyl-CoA mutase